MKNQANATVATTAPVMMRRKTMTGWMFVAPWIIGFVIFGLYPIITSFYYSMTRYDVLRIPQYIGLANYQHLLFEDPVFWTSVWNTLFYTVIRVPIAIFLSLILAVLVNQAVGGMRWFRTMYFIPSIVTGVVLSVLWLWIFNPEYGLINAALARINIDGPLWLQDPFWSKPALIIMSLWSVGGPRMLVFLAALQGISQQLYEAIELDGGGWWAKFRHVTVPTISPVLFLWAVLEVIASLQVFVEAYVMTEGGPLQSTLFYNLYLYQKAFDDFEMGYASAMAWILLVITLVATWAQVKISKKWVHYG
jgi:multiple sugar transport system permease protein